MKKIVKLLGLCLICILGIMLGEFFQVDAQNIKKTYQLNSGNTVYMEYYTDDTALVKGTGIIDRLYWGECRDAIKSSVQKLGFESEVETGENCEEMFRGMSALRELDLSNLDTSKAKEMNGFLQDCSRLTSLNLSGIDTTVAYEMNKMFSGCSSLTTLDVSDLDTDNVSHMVEMFAGCSSLTELDLSNFKTDRTVITHSMFKDCTSLTSINMSSFDTKYVQSFNFMFENCTSLESLDLSNFDTSGAYNLWGIFRGCTNLKYLDLSNFDTGRATWFGGWFDGCTSLEYVDISGWDLENVTQFQGKCFSQTIDLKTIVLPQKAISLDIPLCVDIPNEETSSYVKMLYYNFSDPTDNKTYSNLNGLKGGIVLKRIAEFEVNQTNKVVKYDGNEHGIDIEVLNADDYTIKYKNPKTGRYTDTTCSYKEVGEYVVDYMIQGRGYLDYYGTGTVKIIEKVQVDASLKLDSYSSKVSYPMSNEVVFYIIENTSNGALSVTSSDETKASVSVDGNKVTLTILDVGEVTVDVMTAETADYKEARAVYNLEIDMSEITYNVIYQSSTGLQLGQSKVTKLYGTENEILPEGFNGYTTPEKQTVVWDSIGVKDIIFIYEPIIYTITLTPNNGEPIYTREYTVESEGFTLENPKRVGYTFMGWANVSRVPLQKTVEIKKGTIGNLSFVANWDANEYTYNVYLQSSTGVKLNETTVTKKYGTTQEIIPSAVKGYTTPERQVVEWDSIETKNITFIYEPITYTVTIHMNDGTATINKKYTVETETFSLDTPSREGYTFIGWTKDENVHPTKSVEVAKGTTGDVSFVANWNENLPEIKDTGDGFDVVFGFVMVLFIIEMFMLLIPISQKLEK